MNRLIDFYRSAVGKKAVMAVSGIALFGFVLVHMLGNLKLYLGPESLNHYAEFLREFGQPLLPREGVLWILRIGLLAAAVLHIVSATQVTLDSWRARPESYKRRDVVAATYASRTMRWGGVILFLFILYHLAHFTFGAPWAHGDFVPGDVYHNVVAGFSVPWVSAIYIVAQVFLGFHLYHGLWSMFQTLGWWKSAATSDAGDGRRTFALVFALVVTIGNISFPVSVLTGLVGGS
jgi:succinate dehydrogenase / fumarate reductase cytochrome b subunit